MGDDAVAEKLKMPRHSLYLRAVKVHAEADKPWVEIDGQAEHHLRHVLRLSRGSKISVIDGSGRRFICEITESKPSRMTAAILEVSTPNVESPIKITLAQSLIKAQAFEHILTSCTELGCSRFVPLLTARTVVRINKADAEEKLKRWQAILQSSAAQCERVRVPEIEYPVSLEDWLKKNADETKIILRERSRESFDMEWLSMRKIDKSCIVLAGPEGGFDKEEAERCVANGYIAMSLGPRILKAETAAATAIAIIQNRFGDLK